MCKIKIENQKITIDKISKSPIKNNIFSNSKERKLR